MRARMRRLPLLLATAVAGIVLAAAPVQAQTSPPATAAAAPATATTPKPAAPAKPAPAGGILRLSWIRPIVLRGRVLALAGRPLLVRGRVSRYVPGQRAVVRAYRNGKRFFRRSVPIRGVGHG